MIKLTIGCLGRARHGKGTMAVALKEWAETNCIPAQIVAFADPLKDFLTALVGRSEPFRGTTPEREAPLPEIRWGDLAPNLVFRAMKIWSGLDLSINPTGRQLMQLYGTEVIRENFMPEAWVRYAGSRAAKFSGLTIIEDVRFTNEAKPRTKGGVVDHVYKVVRPGLPLLDHPSESEVDRVPAEYITQTFTNGGSIDLLGFEVRAMSNMIFSDLLAPIHCSEQQEVL